jgi:hypothetical protein
MSIIQIELPDEVLFSLKETPESLTKVIRMAAAAKLYELGKLSSGRVADLAGLSCVRFLQALGQLERWRRRRERSLGSPAAGDISVQ